MFLRGDDTILILRIRTPISPEYHMTPRADELEILAHVSECTLFTPRTFSWYHRDIILPLPLYKSREWSGIDTISSPSHLTACDRPDEYLIRISPYPTRVWTRIDRESRYETIFCLATPESMEHHRKCCYLTGECILLQVGSIAERSIECGSQIPGGIESWECTYHIRKNHIPPGTELARYHISPIDIEETSQLSDMYRRYRSHLFRMHGGYAPENTEYETYDTKK